MNEAVTKKTAIRFLLRISLVLLPLAVILAGCTLPFGFTIVPSGDEVATAIQETFIAMTLEALEANPPQDQEAQQPAEQQQEEQAPTATFTPATPSPTLPPTATHTPGTSMVSVSVDTNCRSGAGQSFEQLGFLLVGEEIEIVARDPGSQFWYVKNPDQGGFCWLWGYYATTTGNVEALPVFTPPPTPTFTLTPTPVIDIVASFREDDTCAPNYYIEFRIENIGTIMFQSVWVTVTNNDDSETKDATHEKFEEWDACVVNQTYEDLDPGDIGHTRSADLVNDPAGKSFSATIKICSEPNLAGTCVTKNLNFTP